MSTFEQKVTQIVNELSLGVVFALYGKNQFSGHWVFGPGAKRSGKTMTENDRRRTVKKEVRPSHLCVKDNLEILNEILY